MEEIFLELKNINKKFGYVKALNNVNLKIGTNEIVALLGDNGAGKSTLVKIISGILPYDSGSLFLKGQKIQNWNSLIARKAGIETVYQDKALSDQQTIYENIFMGREICKYGGFIDINKEKKITEKLLKDMGFTSRLLFADSVVMNCSGGEREGVAITRAMYFQANFVILDEPTTALSITETNKVLNFVLKIKENGKSCMLIMHNIYHAYDISERFVIIDRGAIIEEIKKQDITCEDLIKKMSQISHENKEIEYIS